MTRIRGVEYINPVLEMKGQAHDIIDEMVAKGKKSWVIYMKLRAKLGCEEGKEHFGNMKTYEEVERALAILTEMRDRMNRPKAPPKKKKHTKEQKAKITARNEKRRNEKLQAKLDRKTALGVSAKELLQEVARKNRILAKTPAILRPLVGLFL